MTRILGIDHNTFQTGVFILDFDIDQSGFEVLKCVSAKLTSDIDNRLDLQQRVNKFMHDCGEIRGMIRYFKPDTIVRELHDPHGTRVVQMSMVTGVLDALIAEEKFTFKAGNYKKITPIEWKMITLMDPHHELRKDTKLAKIRYCQVFKKIFTFCALQSVVSTDIMDAFGLAYAWGVRYWAQRRPDFLDGLHVEQRRNLYDSNGVFKQWD
jgi:hypothetical protein